MCVCICVRGLSGVYYADFFINQLADSTCTNNKQNCVTIHLKFLYFDSEEDFSSVFKDKFMINSLKCDLHNYECAFNKNTGDEKENIMRTDISVKLNNNKDNRELIISQDVSSFNSEGFSIIKDKKNGDFNFYNNVYESVVKTEHNENIKVKYFFVDGETKTEIKIEECRNNKNCVFISEYTQKK